ncbi:MAG: hypothetical protein RL522_1336 [Pseudomonadota bacterium]|jgi:hypothetical protein
MNIAWDAVTRNNWDLFHKDHGGALQQSWAYGQALQTLKVRILRAAIMDGTHLAGIAQFMVRRFAGYIALASCTRGPLWHSQVTAADRAHGLRALKKTLPLRPLKVPLLSPDAPASPEMDETTAGLWRVMTGYSTVMLDLRRPLAQLRGDLEGKWRNRLVKAENDAPFTTRVEPNLPECLRLLERETRQRSEKKFHGLPTTFVQAYIDAAPSREQGFAVAYAQARKETSAAMLFLLHGSGATYHVGWSDEAGRKANAHNLLLWRGIDYLQKLGIQRLDLGGVNTRDLPGISRFKLGAGGRVLTLAGTYF